MSKKRPEPAPYTPGPTEVQAETLRAGRELTRAQAKRLALYLALLLKWNRAMNLVGRADWPGVFRDLAADSLHLAVFLRALSLPQAPLTLDLGAGAGLPGIPLRVVWEDGDYVLVELREKRSIFLTQAVAAAQVPRTRVVQGRAETSLQALAALKLTEAGVVRRADLVLSRAFMPWPQLLPLAAELLTPSGILVVLANDPPPAELDIAGPPPAESAGGPAGKDTAGFRLVASMDYPSETRTRYFWALSAASAPSIPPLKMSLVASSSA